MVHDEAEGFLSEAVVIPIRADNHLRRKVDTVLPDTCDGFRISTRSIPFLVERLERGFVVRFDSDRQ